MPCDLAQEGKAESLSSKPRIKNLEGGTLRKLADDDDEVLSFSSSGIHLQQVDSILKSMEPHPSQVDSILKSVEPHPFHVYQQNKKKEKEQHVPRRIRRELHHKHNMSEYIQYKASYDYCIMFIFLLLRHLFQH